MKLVYLGLEVAVESEPTLSVTDLPDPGSPVSIDLGLGSHIQEYNRLDHI